MKTLTAILFILGLGWALIGWIVVLMPFGALDPSRGISGGETMWAIILSLLVLLGYAIWLGWGFRWLTGTYHFCGHRTFWISSLASHLLWAFLLPPAISAAWSIDETLQSFWCQPDEIWATGEGLPYRTWIVINVIVAIYSLIRGDDSARCKIQSEQIAP